MSILSIAYNGILAIPSIHIFMPVCTLSLYYDSIVAKIDRIPLPLHDRYSHRDMSCKLFSMNTYYTVPFLFRNIIHILIELLICILFSYRFKNILKLMITYKTSSFCIHIIYHLKITMCIYNITHKNDNFIIVNFRFRNLVSFDISCSEN